MIELNLRMNDVCSLDLLSVVLDLASVHRMSLQLPYNQLSASRMRMSLSSLFARPDELRSLTLLPLEIEGQYDTPVDTILAIVPSHIKHLTFKIQKLEQMKQTLQIMQHLWSISFNFPYHRKIIGREVIDWLSAIGRIFTYSETDHSLSFWLEHA